MSKNEAWTDDVIEQLRILWDQGHSTSEIGRRLKFSKGAVVGKAHRLDLPGRPSPIQLGRPAETLPADDEERIKALGASGHGYKSICKITGISDYFVRRALGYSWPTDRPAAEPPVYIRAVQPTFVAPAIVAAPSAARVLSAGQCQWLDGVRRAYVQCPERALAGAGVPHPWSYCCAHRAKAFSGRAFVRDAAA